MSESQKNPVQTRRIQDLAARLAEDPHSLTVSEARELCRTVVEMIDVPREQERLALWREAMF